MRKKILKAELLLLFFITGFCVIFFFLEDKLPDNCLVISSRTESVGFFSYYLTSALAIIGHALGIWMILPYVAFSLVYSFLLTKRQRWSDIFYFLLIYTFIASLGFLIYPRSLGSGVNLFFKSYLDKPTSVLVILIVGFLLYWLSFKENLLPAFSFNNPLKKHVGQISHFFKSQSQEWKFWQKKTVNAAPFEEADEVTTSNATSSPMLLAGPPEEQVEIIIEEEQAPPVQMIMPLEEIMVEELPPLRQMPLPEKKAAKPASKDYPFNIQTLIKCLYPVKQTRKNILSPEDSYFSDIITRLEEKLGEFKVDAKVINILKGPVVDTFELELGAGVKVSRITSITEDLSLALCGLPIRMVYPMKGKTTVGVEIPRNPREIIFLDEVLGYADFQETKNKLPIVMGKNAFGDISLVDLASMPHMLVAGSTGSGKSVFVNALLVSLLIKLSPLKLKLILIDPKQLELALYANVPHLMLPVVTDAKAASLALLWACQEMERRYSILKELAVRNIEGFNEKVKTATDQQLSIITGHYHDKIDRKFELPYLVIIVDEFADLILTKMGKDIEANICRLAAKARAAGIHLVVATQRPSVDVITGLIKSNFPTRVSFRVTSSIDSRTILNAMGAEKLLGKGDMLYKHGIDVERLHSAFVDENEIEELVKKLSEMPQVFDQEAMSFIENEGEEENEGGGRGGESLSTSPADDELFQEAVRVVVDHQMASASMLQRRLRIGYNRAANLVEEMESKGIIGPQEGSKPRKVLVTSADGIAG